MKPILPGILIYLASGMTQGDSPPILANRIFIEKSKREMKLLCNGDVLRTYSVSLGGNPIGPKQEEGDGRTPEGIYQIDWRNPESKFHLSLHIDYPNETDRRNAEARGVNPGGEIMIHGLPNGREAMAGSYRCTDWTLGCIAVTNDEIQEIWQLVPDHTVIEIRP